MRWLKLTGLAEPIGVTANHPLYSEDEQAFVPVATLGRGSRLRTRSNESAIVESLTSAPGVHEVFNLEVEDVHQYYVTDLDVLAHNACSGTLTGAVEQLNPEERAIAEELAASGKNIEVIPRAGNPTPDFRVDGVTTELKTIEQLGKNTVKNAIERALTQSPVNILINARGVALDAAAAAEQIARAEGNVGPLVGRVTILLQSGVLRH